MEEKSTARLPYERQEPGGLDHSWLESGGALLYQEIQEEGRSCSKKSGVEYSAADDRHCQGSKTQE